MDLFHPRPYLPPVFFFGGGGPTDERRVKSVAFGSGFGTGFGGTSSPRWRWDGKNGKSVKSSVKNLYRFWKKHGDVSDDCYRKVAKNGIFFYVFCVIGFFGCKFIDVMG